MKKLIYYPIIVIACFPLFIIVGLFILYLKMEDLFVKYLINKRM